MGRVFFIRSDVPPDESSIFNTIVVTSTPTMRYLTAFSAV